MYLWEKSNREEKGNRSMIRPFLELPSEWRISEAFFSDWYPVDRLYRWSIIKTTWELPSVLRCPWDSGSGSDFLLTFPSTRNYKWVEFSIGVKKKQLLPPFCVEEKKKNSSSSLLCFFPVCLHYYLHRTLLTLVVTKCVEVFPHTKQFTAVPARCFTM